MSQQQWLQHLFYNIIPNIVIQIFQYFLQVWGIFHNTFPWDYTE